MNSSRFHSDLTQPDLTRTTSDSQTFGHSDETVADVVSGTKAGQVPGQEDETVIDVPKGTQSTSVDPPNGSPTNVPPSSFSENEPQVFPASSQPDPEFSASVPEPRMLTSASRFHSDLTRTTSDSQTFSHSDETVADVVSGTKTGQTPGQEDETVIDVPKGTQSTSVDPSNGSPTNAPHSSFSENETQPLPASPQPNRGLNASGNPKKSPPNASPSSFSEHETESLPASLQPDHGLNASGNSEKSRFPVQNWDRYQFVKLLGQGGMGQVFKAFDLRLKRMVALKFLLGDHPELVRRFHHEAQAQARIDHDNVCRVYEVGEVEGKPFIAMEFVDGPSLKEAAADLRLEEKILIFRDVALALHAAHRLGFIHRDVKPANIMLEQREDGTWRPFVMDFGLVRELGTDGATATGIAMGTPAYMSPEQADGDHRRVDRRSDIYSLGATLYFLLAGRPPFEAETGMSLMLKVLDRELDPEPVRRLNPGIPASLDRIALTCLRKDPNLRYESAKALADDLQRYLEGEPVQAADVSWRYRARRLIARHRVALSLGMVALMILLVLSGLLVQSRWQATQQARYAYQFGREAEQIDNIMQRAYLLPLHDIRQEKTQVRQRLEAVQAEMARGGKVAAAAGNFALGRGHLALGQYPQARQYLELAWNQGVHNPELALALGKTLTELYTIALLEAPGRDNPTAQAQYLAKIEQEFRTPALAYLKTAQTASGTGSAYAEALIAFCENRLNDSRAQAALAFQAQPWLYEAKKLEGEIWVQQAIHDAEVGKYESAATSLEQAAALYQQALEIGRSDPTLYAAEGHRLFLKLNQIIKQGKFDEKLAPMCLNVLANGLKADLDSGVVHENIAMVHFCIGEREFYLEKDPRPTLRQAIASGTRAIELDPLKGDGYSIVGQSYRIIGQYEMDYDEGNPPETLNRGIAIMEEGLRRTPTKESLQMSLGNTLIIISVCVGEAGGDPTPYWNRATTMFEEVIRQDPKNTTALSNLACLWIERLYHYDVKYGRDPEASFQSSLEALNKMVAVNPKLPLAFTNLGILYFIKLRSMVDHGQPIAPLAVQARQHLLHSLELEPDMPLQMQYLAEIAVLEATQALQTGADPTPALAEARRWVSKVHPLSDAFALFKLAQIELITARELKRQNRPPWESLKKAQQSIQPILEAELNEIESLLTAVEISLYEAEWKQTEGAQIKNILTEGVKRVKAALACSVDHPRALAFKGALLHLQAKTETDPLRAGQIQAESQAMLQRAFQLNPLLKSEFGGYLPQ